MRTLSDRVAARASRVWFRLTGSYLPRPVVVNMFGGELLQALIPNEDGNFDGVWRFEFGGEGVPAAQMVCTLTPSEARAIADRNQTAVGFLEPVRDHMTWRDVILTADFTGTSGQTSSYFRMFRVPNTASASEEELGARLDAALDQATAFHAKQRTKHRKVKRTAKQDSKSWAKEPIPSKVPSLSQVRALVPA